jgi:hypothetical protein
VAAKADEVKFGEDAEADILQRWARLSKYATGVSKWLKAGQFTQFDFAGFSDEYIPLTYVEIKNRRSKWGVYGDVIFPIKKHDFARRLGRNSIAMVGVTAYSCGTIVEVDLADVPDEEKFITRRDRPGTTVKHGLYRESQLGVFLPEGWKRET